MADGLDSAAIKVLSDATIVRYCQLAATFVTLYDHALSFGDEVEYIWKRRWSSSKILYINSRYLGDILLIFESILYLRSQPTLGVCVAGFLVFAWLGSAVLWFTQTILFLRIYAMYDRSRIIFLSLVATFVSEILVMAYLLVYIQKKSRASAPAHLSAVTVVTCIPTSVPHYSFLYFIPVLITEAIMFMFALWKFVEHMQEIQVLRRWTRRSTLHILLRDNMGYFFTTLITYAAATILWLVYAPSWFQIPVCFTNAATIIMGCRLVLNLSEAYHSQLIVTGSVWESPMGWRARLPRVPVSRRESTSAGARRISESPIELSGESSVV